MTNCSTHTIRNLIHRYDELWIEQITNIICQAELSEKTNDIIRSKERRQRLCCHRVPPALCAKYRLTEGWYTIVHSLSARGSYDNNSTVHREFWIDTETEVKKKKNRKEKIKKKMRTFCDNRDAANDNAIIHEISIYCYR